MEAKLATCEEKESVEFRISVIYNKGQDILL